MQTDCTLNDENMAFCTSGIHGACLTFLTLEKRTHCGLRKSEQLALMRELKLPPCVGSWRVPAGRGTIGHVLLARIDIISMCSILLE